MKRLASAAAALCAALALAVPAQAQISGSPHDFRLNTTWSGSSTTDNEICVFCHAPHNNKDASLYKPLWNHEVSASTSYSMYVGLDLQGQGSAITGVSALCLSCHDGVLAVNNYGTNDNTGNKLTSSDPEFFGTDLTNDHPISITYEDATGAGTQDDGIRDRGTTVTGVLAGSGISTIADLLDGSGATALIQCSSCHDVHNQVPTGVASLLHKSNNGSALCLTCHIK